MIELAHIASDAWALVRAAGVSPRVKVTKTGLEAFGPRLHNARFLLEASSGVASGIEFSVVVDALPETTELIGARWVNICPIGDSEWVVMVGAMIYGPWTAQASEMQGKWRLRVLRPTCERFILRCARSKDIDAQAWAKEALDIGLARLEEKGIKTFVDEESDAATISLVQDTKQ